MPALCCISSIHLMIRFTILFVSSLPWSFVAIVGSPITPCLLEKEKSFTLSSPTTVSFFLIAPINGIINNSSCVDSDDACLLSLTMDYCRARSFQQNACAQMQGKTQISQSLSVDLHASTLFAM